MYVGLISKFLYKNFREHDFAITCPSENFSKTQLKQVFSKIFQVLYFFEKIHFVIFSKIFILCVCEIFSPLVIFSRSRLKTTFSQSLITSIFENTSIDLFSIIFFIENTSGNVFENAHYVCLRKHSLFSDFRKLGICNFFENM
jgi:hypothetical protein